MKIIPILFACARRVVGACWKLVVEVATTGIDLNTLIPTMFARMLSTFWK